MYCLFCNGPGKNYKPPPGVEFICGICVQLLLMADQEDLTSAYAGAIEKDYTGKAEAIKMFIERKENEQRRPKTKKFERAINREGINRPVRRQEVNA